MFKICSNIFNLFPEKYQQSSSELQFMVNKYEDFDSFIDSSP